MKHTGSYCIVEINAESYADQEQKTNSLGFNSTPISHNHPEPWKISDNYTYHNYHNCHLHLYYIPLRPGGPGYYTNA